jgi:hypothetical protein
MTKKATKVAVSSGQPRDSSRWWTLERKSALRASPSACVLDWVARMAR